MVDERICDVDKSHSFQMESRGNSNRATKSYRLTTGVLSEFFSDMFAIL